MKDHVLALITAATVLACATPYQRINAMGGFVEQHLAQDVYRVVFYGNGFTPHKRAEDYAMLRAAEIGAQLGYRYMAIEGREDASRVTMADLGSTSYTTGHVSSSGSYSGTTRSHSYTVPIHKPGVALVVRYFAEAPTTRYLEMYGVQQVRHSIMTTYRIQPFSP